jgi:ankyrin repeat protein
VKHDPVLAAQVGDVEVLHVIAKNDPDALHKEDSLGWRPIHEAVRSGHLEAVTTLLLYGADQNHVTKTGVSPLNIAKQFLPADNPVIAFLESVGAKDIGPEL